ncbi:Chitinase [Asanoa hainanensis]|uniref:chitinase n=1 Tax=Asanoa hainanensis TaxID=560556 RepID=A0A239LML3_9ACTN|nr:cellulose binding domain-containing protein [Asanoa hainanensis]SNT31132.1 Chitinase [Asanoa hainanensis]
MRRTRSIVMGLVAVLAAAGGAVAFAGSAAAAGPTATFTKVSDWGSGWEGRYTVANGGTSALTSWTVAFDLPSGANINTFWDADMTRSGQRFTFRNKSWNGTVAPGASVSFGFNGSGAATPTNCTLNGASCGGGGPTTPPTSNPPTSNPPNPTVPGAPTALSVTGTTSSSISLGWTAPSGTVTGYRVYEGSTVRATVTTTSATIGGLGASTTHTYTVAAYNSVGEGPRSASVTGTTGSTTPPPTGLPKHALIGYLHASFANGSGYVRMADVPADWDIINLAFGEPTSVTSGDIRFQLCPAAECPGVETEAEFIAAIRAKQAAGKKVLISIGGQNGQVQLTTTAARDRFVSSVAAIIDRYGLDGLDIDFEGHSLSLNTGDTDFRNPTTPVIVNLISAVRTLKQRYGSRFVLTMAPETFFVQLGYQYYGSGPWGGQDPRAGSYLPVIHALRDDITVLHVQDYNSGPIMGLDNQYHTMGGADFHIAMTDMLMAGFPVAGNTANVFPPLREDQVAFGAPSSVSAGNGYVGPAGIQQAVNCLVRGQSCGGYTPRSGTNPNFRGLMTWSINWDRYYNWEFRLNHEPFLNALP